MRISDWSSDVCSSDLTLTTKPRFAIVQVPVEELGLTEEQRFEAWWIARFLEMYGTKDQGNPLTEHLDGPRPSVVGRPGAVLWTIQMRKIGRAHVCTPVTNAHLVCRLLLENKKLPTH